MDEKTDLTVFMEPERDQIFCRMILFLLLMWNDVETVVCLDKKKPKDYVEIGVDAEDYYRIKGLEDK